MLYTGFMTFYYPIIKANQATLDAMLRLWPKEMQAAFSLTGNLTDVGTFFNVYVFLMIWPIVAAIGGILIATRAVAADLDRGFLELPLATRISRPAYLATSIAGQAIGMALLVAATIATILVSGPVIGESWDMGRFAAGRVVIFAFGCAIEAVTTLLAVATLSRGRGGRRDGRDPGGDVPAQDPRPDRPASRECCRYAERLPLRSTPRRW